MSDCLASCLKDWGDIDKEFFECEERHKAYCQKIADVKNAEKKCVSDIAHQRHVIKQLAENVKGLKKSQNLTQEEIESLNELEQKINKRKDQFRDLEDVLPHENGLYLKIVLGSVNVSLLSKQDKYKYKQNYELFKLYVTVVTLVLGIILWVFLDYRVTDAAFQFLLVWYYCTLTIREHILKVNGSRIKGWWITHHFISTACAGLLLIWPDGYAYHMFRPQFILFSIYLSLVQLIQYYYQSGTLYRLRALGERRNMDITVEGFQSWMWKGLSFVFPFLIVAYLFQLYNAYTLFVLAFDPLCSEWQVFVLSIIFFVLFLGNIRTAAVVLRQKADEKSQSKETDKFGTKWLNRYKSANGNGQDKGHVKDSWADKSWKNRSARIFIFLILTDLHCHWSWLF